ncbi:MAG: signal peptide peptidase SppA [Planctomycetia bacterium]|nr:signal peptide peptidase SppA [Planctomycetia bacterium]
MPRPAPRGEGLRAFGILGGGCLGAFILITLVAFGFLYIAESVIMTLREKVSVRLNMPNFGINRPEFTEEIVSGPGNAEHKIVVLHLDGTILTGEPLVRQIRQIRRDQNVRAVVLRINSPGGTVAGADLIYHHLTNLREGRELYESDGASPRKVPIVVSMGGVAASGGYYAAMSVGQTPDTIFAEPTTLTGSIGVLIPHYDLSPLMEKLGAVNDSIVSHPMKNAGSMTKKMTAEERAVFQGLVDDSFARFRDVVRGGRSRFAQSPSELDAVATGQIYTANQALNCGLVDRIGFLEDAVQRASELAGCSALTTKVVRYQKTDLLSDLLSVSAGSGEITEETLRSLVTTATGGTDSGSSTTVAQVGRLMEEFATPRAWMLWTTLPAAFSAHEH